MKPYPEIPEGLVVEHDGPVLRVRLDRPERRNSLTDPIVYALVDVIDAAGGDEAVRVVHLTGTGDHFCSGFDLGGRAPGPDRPRVGSIHRRMHAHVNRLIPAMLTTQTPIVCTAPGWIIGLGLDLALAADFTIVADDARLWAPFTTFGFTPDSGASWLIPRLAGVARAKEMLMLGTKVSGADAAAWGLVHRAVPATELAAASDELVARLAAAPTVALGLTKLLVHRGLTADLDRHLADEAWAMEVSSRSDDFKEYGRATREKRDPDFRGR
ncbi:MAG: enoyl-CoA hydratase/isomerase family protein [Acidimicrobiales bacterium]|nr:enoyl-CoA hydratase/isomerase family protein [Acidimicrobiales bacterium]